MSLKIETVEDMINLDKDQALLQRFITAFEAERVRVNDRAFELKQRQDSIDKSLSFLYSLKKKELD